MAGQATRATSQMGRNAAAPDMERIIPAAARPIAPIATASATCNAVTPGELRSLKCS